MKIPLPLKIAPAHTALIVIDIQRDFAAPDGVLGKLGRDFSMIDAMLAKLEEIIAAAKQANVPVLYAKQIFDRKHLTALQQESNTT